MWPFVLLNSNRFQLFLNPDSDEEDYELDGNGNLARFVPFWCKACGIMCVDKPAFGMYCCGFVVLLQNSMGYKL